MDLSVQSALARVGKDPWTEAARLAGLLRAAAADSLAATIAGLPAGSRPRVQARMIALCLVRLLPGQDHPVPDTLADGSRLVRCTGAILLAGTMLSTALVLELLVGTACQRVWANSHAGPPGAPVDATATSRPSPMEHPHAGDAHPSAAAEDRGQSPRCPAAGNDQGWLPAGSPNCMTERGEGARGLPPTPLGSHSLQKAHLAAPYQQAASAAACSIRAWPEWKLQGGAHAR